jgi:hypothetical protein
MTRRALKPPVVKASNVSLPVPGATVSNSIHRASSVTGSEIPKSVVEPDLGIRNQNKSQNLSPYPTDQSATTTYNAPEEPLRNPEKQYKESISNLKTDDW